MENSSHPYDVPCQLWFYWLHTLDCRKIFILGQRIEKQINGKYGGSLWLLIILFCAPTYMILHLNRFFEWDTAKDKDSHDYGLKTSEKVLKELENIGQQLALAFSRDGSVLAVGGEVGIRLAVRAENRVFALQILWMYI